MKAVIFAAGRGNRLRPLTDNLPKPLVSVCGRPILSYVMESLPERIGEIHIVTGYLGHKIKNYLGDFYHGRKIFYHEQHYLNGTGGAFEIIKHLLDDKVLILNADDIYDASDLLRLVNCPGLAILGLSKFGTDQNAMRVEDGFLCEFVSIVNSEYIKNAGAYLLDAFVKDMKMIEISVRGNYELSLPHSLVELSKMNKIKVILAKKWSPIGTPEELDKYKENC